jgi:hypothetical protein
MRLSDTQRLILTQAAGHPAGLVMPPASLPPAPHAAVARALLKAGLVAPGEQSNEAHAPLAWKLDGEQVLLVITEAGRQALAPAAAELPAPTVEDAARAAQAPSSNRKGLRAAAAALLTVWDAEGDRDALAAPMDTLRALLAKPTAAPRSAASRQPRPGTKQEMVLTMLRRAEGATVVQIAEATGWAHHTVRGFFAGLKKRSIEVSVLERVRQSGPNKAGAKGSYSIYHIAEAG